MWEEDWKSAFLSLDSDGPNLIRFILAQGYLDVDTSGSPEYYENALLLLSKVAQNFPDTLTTLWSEELN